MACDIKTEPALPNSVTIYKPEARDIMRHLTMLNNPKCWHRLAVSDKFNNISSLSRWIIFNRIYVSR